MEADLDDLGLALDEFETAADDLARFLDTSISAALDTSISAASVDARTALLHRRTAVMNTRYALHALIVRRGGACDPRVIRERIVRIHALAKACEDDRLSLSRGVH